MQHGSMLRALVHDTSMGGLMIRQGRASNQWFYLLWSPLLVAYCTWRGLQCAVRHSFIPGSWSAWIVPVQALLLLLDDVLVGTTRLARKASHFASLVLLLWLTITILALPESLGFSLMALTWVLAMHGLLDLLDTGCDFQEYGCLGDFLYTHPGNAGPPDPNEWKYGILCCWRSRESRGIELCAR